MPDRPGIIEGSRCPAAARASCPPRPLRLLPPAMARSCGGALTWDGTGRMMVAAAQSPSVVVHGRPRSGQEVVQMSVAYFFEIPQLDDGTAQQINAYINERLGNRQPDGGIYHAEGPDG